jgi:hypothetical protein
MVGDNRFTQKPGNTGGCVGFTHDGFGTVGVVQFDANRPPSSGNAALLGIVEYDPKRARNDSVTAVLANAAVGGRPRPQWQGYAGIFNGPVAVNGPLTVYGQSYKSAAVPHPDGSHRRLYCLETPESLFEDVGRARLKNGQADVKLDPDFAALVATKDYHVFLTPEGDCAGLYVAKRSRDGFRVQEIGDGKSNVAFSYRIVAKRADIVAKRLERVEPPAALRPTFEGPAAPPITEPSPPNPRERTQPTRGEPQG